MHPDFREKSERIGYDLLIYDNRMRYKQKRLHSVNIRNAAFGNSLFVIVFFLVTVKRCV